MLTTTNVYRTVGGKKTEPVRFFVGIDDPEEVTLYPTRIIPWARKAKFADLMLDGSPGSTEDTGNVITRDRLVGIELVQQRLFLLRPGTKNLAPQAKLASFLLDRPPIALEVDAHLLV